MNNSGVIKVAKQLFENECLCEEHCIYIKAAQQPDIKDLIPHYIAAFKRGDWFGERAEYSELEKDVKRFIENSIASKEIIFIIFKDKKNNLLGSTLLEFGHDCGVLIDETL